MYEGVRQESTAYFGPRLLKKPASLQQARPVEAILATFVDHRCFDALESNACSYPTLVTEG